jgi:predicted ribosomally synthesized peptide with nif11-like leader
MTTDNIQKLKKLIQSNQALREKLGASTTGKELHRALISVAAAEGLALTEDELQRFITKETADESAELSPGELESVAGRFHIYPPKTATVQFGETLIRTSRWFGIPLRR